MHFKQTQKNVLDEDRATLEFWVFEMKAFYILVCVYLYKPLRWLLLIYMAVKIWRQPDKKNIPQSENPEKH